MCKKALIVVLSGISLVSTLAWGDYITPEHNIEIADNVYARESAAKRINIYKLTDKVVELYNQDLNYYRLKPVGWITLAKRIKRFKALHRKISNVTDPS